MSERGYYVREKNLDINISLVIKENNFIPASGRSRAAAQGMYFQ